MAEHHLAHFDVTQWLVNEGYLGKEYRRKFYSAKRIKEILVIARPELEQIVGREFWELEDMIKVRDYLGIPRRLDKKEYTPPKPAPKPKLTKKEKKQRANERRKERLEKRADLLSDTKYRALTTKAREHLDYDFIISNAFLDSVEWKRLRFAKLSTSDGKCACCNRTKNDGIYLNVDHIKPRRLFPELALDFDNLQILCNICNEGKGNLSVKKF